MPYHLLVCDERVYAKQEHQSKSRHKNSQQICYGRGISIDEWRDGILGAEMEGL